MTFPDARSHRLCPPPGNKRRWPGVTPQAIDILGTTDRWVRHVVGDSLASIALSGLVLIVDGDHFADLGPKALESAAARHAAGQPFL